MSKVNQALKDLREDSKHHLDSHIVYLNERLDIIEEKLKEGKMERTLRIRLENINYELVREKEDNDKKLKDLELIKKCLYVGHSGAIAITSYGFEHYDLLKEALQ